MSMFKVVPLARQVPSFSQKYCPWLDQFLEKSGPLARFISKLFESADISKGLVRARRCQRSFVSFTS